MFVESVIKHNLSVASIELNPIKLIDNKNSIEVQKKIGTIIDKEKHKRNNEDLIVLRQQNMVQCEICLVAYRCIDETDIVENIKNEFIKFKENEIENKEVKKSKLK